MTGNPKPCSADHSIKVVHSIHRSIHCSDILNTDPDYERRQRFLYLSIHLILIFYLFQMCELSSSESPADRLSSVGLILRADSHVAVRLPPIRIWRPINGLTFMKTDCLLLLF